MDLEVRNRKIARMTATGLSSRKISEELAKVGENLSTSGVKKVLSRSDVKEIIEKEKSRLIEILPQCVTNYVHWIKNAKMFSDKTDKEIAFKATTKALESTGLVSGAVSEQVKITINQSEVILSPVIEKMLAGFMNGLSKAEPVLPKAIDVSFEVVETPSAHEVLSNDKSSHMGEVDEKDKTSENTKKLYTPIEVCWDDAVLDQSGWADYSTYDFENHMSAMHFKTTGYFLKIIDNAFFLCQSFRPDGQIGCVFCIPISEIKSIRITNE